MATWRLSDFNGYGHGQRDIAGEVRGTKGRYWRFFDGIETHLVPMAYSEWNAATHIMRMPNWLAIKLYASASRRIRSRYTKR